MLLNFDRLHPFNENILGFYSRGSKNKNNTAGITKMSFKKKNEPPKNPTLSMSIYEERGSFMTCSIQSILIT